MRVLQTLRSGLAVSVALLGAAVAAAAVPPTERAKTDGFAVLTVVHNGGLPYSHVTVERMEDGRNADLAGGGAFGQQRVDDSAKYAGWLHPGTYRFLRLTSSTSNGLVTSTGTLDLEALQLPTFTVEAGEMVDLGTWLQQPKGDRIALALLKDEFGHARGNLILAESVAGFPRPPTKWVGAEVWIRGPSASELLEASKRATAVLGPPQFDEEGNAYFPSSLGQVLRRTPRGAWRHLDTGTLGTLSSLVIDGPNIYASSDHNQFLRSSDGGATWAAAEVPIAANVTGIARLPNGDFVAVTEAAFGKGTQLLRGPDLLALPPTPWTTLDTGGTPGYIARTAAIAGPVKDRLIVWADPRSLHVYDIANDRWTASRAKRPLGQLNVNGKAGLFYAAGPTDADAVAAGIRLQDGVVSADGGATWQSMNLGRHNGVGFRDRSNGIALVIDGAYKLKTVVETTSDGGVTWNQVETPVPGFCTAAQYLPPTDELVCVTWDGYIMTTRTGQEWTTERNGY